jgi:uncharacterized membrane protein
MSQTTRRSDPLVAALPWVLAALFGGIALHLIVLLALPVATPQSAYRRLTGALAPGVVHFSPRPAPGAEDEPAFADPFAALAACRFDLSQGPLRLRATGDGEHFLSVSVRLADGAVIYSGNDSHAPRGRFNILVLTRIQADALDEAAEDAEDQGAAGAEDELRLIAPAKKGFAVIRALGLRDGDIAAAEKIAASAECRIEKTAKSD